MLYTDTAWPRNPVDRITKPEKYGFTCRLVSLSGCFVVRYRISKLSDLLSGHYKHGRITDLADIVELAFQGFVIRPA